jgi:uncharacterized coiled-coil protein SlyX
MEEKTVTKAEKAAPSGFSLNSLMSTTTMHIIMEVITICGMGIYFNRRISKQQKIIDELAAKLAECEENVQRHEDILEKIVARINSDPRVVSRQPTAEIPKQPHKMPSKSVPSAKREEEEASATPLPLGLLADIMGVASGSLSNTSYSHVAKEPVLPSIEELDSELENELQDLKEEKKE